MKGVGGGESNTGKIKSPIELNDSYLQILKVIWETNKLIWSTCKANFETKKTEGRGGGPEIQYRDWAHVLALKVISNFPQLKTTPGFNHVPLFDN